MLFKGCHRCGGDLFKEEYLGQTDLVCLQCGYRPSALFVAPHARKQQLSFRREPRVKRPETVGV